MRWLFAVNLILGLIGVSWLLVRTSHRWNEYPNEIRKLLTLLAAVYAALIATSAEMFADSTESSVRLAVVILAVKTYALWVLWTTRTSLYRTGTRGAGNGDADHPNEDIA